MSAAGAYLDYWAANSERGPWLGGLTRSEAAKITQPKEIMHGRSCAVRYGTGAGV